MKQMIEVEFTTEQAIEVLTTCGGLSKEQAISLYAGGTIRHMGHFPITVDEAIETISEANPDSAFTRMLGETQQMLLYKGLANNPRALTELASMTWEERDVIDFLEARFGGRNVADNETIIANIKTFLENNH